MYITFLDYFILFSPNAFSDNHVSCVYLFVNIIKESIVRLISRKTR